MFGHNLIFWVLSQFECFRLVTIKIFTFRVLSQFEFCHSLTFWVKFCHPLSFLVLSPFEFLCLSQFEFRVIIIKFEFLSSKFEFFSFITTVCLHQEAMDFFQSENYVVEEMLSDIEESTNGF